MIQGYATILVYSVMYEIGVSTVEELDSTMLEIMLLFLILICNAGIHYHHCRLTSQQAINHRVLYGRTKSTGESSLEKDSERRTSKKCARLAAIPSEIFSEKY